MKDLRYPRRTFIRGALRFIGRLALPLLTRMELTGLERFPSKGPVIVVGNHTGTMEVALMTIYARRPIEYLGSVDIPHPPLVQFFNSLYGAIPIHRGRASRASLEAGLSVLAQNGVLGLFPQGGIWEPTIQRVQTGVAWLSYRGQAPVLPVGFNSTQGALDETLRLRRPPLQMNVGAPLPPVTLNPNLPRKPQLEAAANRIMQAIWELVPEEDRPAQSLPLEENFEFELTLHGRSGERQDLPVELSIEHGGALSKFIHRTILFNNLLIKLDLPIAPLRRLHRDPNVGDLKRATSAILGYLEQENPYYFTYRYGQSEGSAMEAGLRELNDALAWAQANGLSVRGRAVRRFRDPETDDLIVQDMPPEDET
ncbi:MAG: lysophospholipid acyltransferase family protein [Anaerolineales bacterium]